MSDSNPKEKSNGTESRPVEAELIQPSWKPLLWMGGILLSVIVLWEIFLDLGMNLFELIFEVLEKVWLVLIEAPEEFIEDVLADWLKNHFPHEAERYSEITTAIGLTPLKLLLVIFLARWAWRRARSRLWPRIQHWFHVRVTEVKLAWAELGWPYRILGAMLLLGILLVLI
jgi:hypothetical protein